MDIQHPMKQMAHFDLVLMENQQMEQAKQLLQITQLYTVNGTPIIT